MNPMIDVSDVPEQFHIQCEDIHLISSFFGPVGDAEEHPKESSIHFEIKVFVQKSEAFSHLETQIIHVMESEQGETQAKLLKFGLMGKLTTQEKIEPSQLGEFASFYSLSILWPYAREYASDQFRRGGELSMVLPIINPQVITEHLMEDNLVEVIILEENQE